MACSLRDQHDVKGAGFVFLYCGLARSSARRKGICGMANLGAVMRSFLTADQPRLRAGVNLVVKVDRVVMGGGRAGIPRASMSERQSRGDDLAQRS